MTWAQRIAMFRFWLSENPGVLGIAIVLLCVTLLYAGCEALSPRSTGPETQMSGRIIDEVPPPDARTYSLIRVIVELDDGVRFRTRAPLT